MSGTYFQQTFGAGTFRSFSSGCISNICGGLVASVAGLLDVVA